MKNLKCSDTKMKQIRHLKFYCKYCKTIEIIPEYEYGKLITALYCPKCMAKKKMRKMKPIENA